MKDKNNLARIIKLARPFWPNLALILFLIVVISSASQLEPIISKAFIDLIGGKQATVIFWQPTFVGLIMFAFTLRLFQVIMRRGSMYLSNLYGTKLLQYLRQIAFVNLLRLSVAYYNKNQSGKILSKLNRCTSAINGILFDLFTQLVPGFLTAILSAILVMRINVLAGVAALTIFIPYFFIKFWRYRAMSKVQRKNQKVMDSDYSHFNEVLANMRLVKIFNAEKFEINRFARTIGKIVANRISMENVATLGYSGDALVEMWTLGIYAYIYYLGLKEAFGLGTVVLLVQYVNMIRQPMWSLSQIFWGIKDAQVGLEDYFEILDEEPTVKETKNSVTLSNVQGFVEFKNVSFKYPEKSGQEVFNNLNFSIKPGMTLALVGKSGVGKTTLANLLVRFYDPDEGDIYLDGISLKDLTFQCLHKNIGLVMQDSYIYNGTIIQNLKYGKPGASEKEIIEACRVANAMEFIDKLPKGLYTEVGERGVRLSGGQRQRLSIARTLLQNPRVLILDEATSALDSYSEKLVQDALWKLIEDRTTIIIAHRLSTIQKADMIAILGNKHILEIGSHKQLLQQDGLYASLFKIQSGKNTDLQEWELVA